MTQLKALELIEDIGDIEGNFIVELAQGISKYINTIQATLNNVKRKHLSFIDNMQDSNLMGDIKKKDFVDAGFNTNKDGDVYKVPMSMAFYTVNNYYTENLMKLLENSTYIEDTIDNIKRFRTKDKLRMSVSGPDGVTLSVEKNLEGIKEASGSVFDPKDNAEYAKVGTYFGNINNVHKAIDSMHEIAGKINDRDLHNMVVNVDRLGDELKKLIKLLDSTANVISRDAMNKIILNIRVCADYITAVSNLYYIHMSSISSLTSLKQIIK